MSSDSFIHSCKLSIIPLNHAKYNVNSNCFFTLCTVHAHSVPNTYVHNLTLPLHFRLLKLIRRSETTRTKTYFLGYQMNPYLIPTIPYHFEWHPMNYDQPIFRYNFFFSCFNKRISREHTYKKCILSMHCYIVKLNRNSVLPFYFHSCTIFRCSLLRFVSL